MDASSGGGTTVQGAEGLGVDVRAVEEASLNAWPPHRQLVLDGWLLRFAAGYTSRANSVQPLYAGSLPVAEKIARCEALYAAAGQPPIFRLTPLADPPALDALLADRGYARVDETSVQVLHPLSAPTAPVSGLEVALEPTAPWLEAFVQHNRIAAPRVPALQGILAHLQAPAGYAALTVAGPQGRTVAACGMAVLQEQTLGLFNLVTDAALRRQGHGRRLMQGLLAWGAARGARTAYLQVVATNTGAARLYAELGFRELYRYWYRRRD